MSVSGHKIRNPTALMAGAVAPASTVSVVFRESATAHDAFFRQQ
jgi:hypothetical protein